MRKRKTDRQTKREKEGESFRYEVRQKESETESVR